MFAIQDPKPFFVHVAPPESPQHQLGRVIVGAFGLTGAMVIAAVVVGLALATVWIVWRRFRRTYDVDAPPSLGAMPLSRHDNIAAPDEQAKPAGASSRR